MTMTADLSAIANYAAVRARLYNTPKRKITRDFLCIASSGPFAAPKDAIPKVIHIDIAFKKLMSRFPVKIRDVEYDDAPPKLITIRQIIREVSDIRGVPREGIRSARRNNDLVLARHEVMWRADKETSLTTTQVGLALGNRDHTTVMHGIKRHQARIDAGEVKQP
jgi:chromosomal replication initiation ATPase DnaA